MLRVVSILDQYTRVDLTGELTRLAKNDTHTMWALPNGISWFTITPVHSYSSKYHKHPSTIIIGVMVTNLAIEHGGPTGPMYHAVMVHPVRWRHAWTERAGAAVDWRSAAKLSWPGRVAFLICFHGTMKIGANFPQYLYVVSRIFVILMFFLHHQSRIYC